MKQFTIDEINNLINDVIVDDKLINKETQHKRQSESMSGKHPPNYGKQSSEETRQKLSDVNRGKIAWNKGLPAVESVKLSLSKNSFKYGQVGLRAGATHTDEAKKKMSETRKGRTPPNKGKSADPESVRKSAEKNTKTIYHTPLGTFYIRKDMIDAYKGVYSLVQLLARCANNKDGFSKESK